MTRGKDAEPSLVVSGAAQDARETSDAGTADAAGAGQPNQGESRSKRSAPGLHLIATPIGNLADLSARAVTVLRGVDVIACEDTRVSQRLLRAYDIRVPLIPYHDHNGELMRPRLLAQLAEGRAIGLISDAGTPLVSDPGFKLVRDAIAAGLPVHAVPGASAPLMALILSGLPTDRFLFAGFLPPRSAARRGELAELAPVRATLIFFESPARLAASLADMAESLGDRPAAVARELTKMYEQVVRGSLRELAARYESDGPPKGEIVIVVGPPLAAVASAETLDDALRRSLRQSSLRDAADQVAEALGLPRKTVYRRALELAAGSDDT